MSLGLNQRLMQRLELKLQPRQILCNELLILPNLDLKATLEKELNENIFLEAEERPDAEPLMPAPKVPMEMTPPGGDREPAVNGEEVSQDPLRVSEMLDFFRESRSSVSSTRGDIPEAFDLEGRYSLPVSWRTSLAEDLRLERMPDDVALAAEYLALNLDERGYVVESLAEIASNLEVDPEAVEEALEILQRVAHPGVGARSLQERLLLRCKASPEPSRILIMLLEKACDDLMAGRFDLLRRKFSLSEEDFRSAVEEFRKVSKDALPTEEGEPANSVYPDATVTWEDGNWKVTLHDESLPNLRVNAVAEKLARKREGLTEKEAEYVHRMLNRAKYIRDALEMRRKTLRRIIESVVQHQIGFFEHGTEGLVPLRQEEVAKELEMHASTVSRAVQEKYVDSKHGLYALKAFFPRGMENQTRDSVQEQLAALIAGESPTHPLSDDKLVELMRQQGIELSRRTVCKYRDELNIPPATRRKSLKSFAR